MKLFDFFKFKNNGKKKPSANNPDLGNFEAIRSNTDKINFSSRTTLIDVLTFIKDNSFLLGIELNKPATKCDIDLFEECRVKLPQDFKRLYDFSNGFETDQDLFRLIPLNEIIDRGSDDYCTGETSFHFAEYLIYSDMWTVEININDIENYKIYNKADTVVYLTNSLTEFLCVFLNKGIYDGLYQWREDKRKP